MFSPDKDRSAWGRGEEQGYAPSFRDSKVTRKSRTGGVAGVMEIGGGELFG